MTSTSSPVVRWTPGEAWLMVELARRMLGVELDGGPLRHAADDGPFRIAVAEDTPEDVALVIAIDATATARLALDPTPRSGHAWRSAWTLELSRDGVTLGTLAMGAALDVGPGPPIRAALRVQQRAIVRPLDGRDEVVPIADVSHHRYTKQSSATEVEPPGGLAPYAAPTECEREPWWELDLGRGVYVGWFRVDLAPIPPGATIACRAFGFQTPSGDPPPHSEIAVTYGADGDRAWIACESRTIARFLRVTITGVDASLAVLGAEVLASDVHADTMLATLRRACAVFRDRVMCEPALTYGDAWVRGMTLARALAARIERAAAPRAVIAVLVGNRAEWIVIELAAIARGYTVVALAPDDPDDRIASILARTKAIAAIAEGDTAVRIASLAPGLALIVGLDRETTGAVVGFAALEAEGGPEPPPVDRRSEDDPFALLFTSGSTGTPKGAMRSYGAFFDVVASYQIGHSPRHLSFQPLSHLSERMYLPAVLMWGGTIAFSRGGAHLMDELRAFEPTTLGAVPRVYEVLHATYTRRLRAAIAAEPATPRGVLEARGLAEARASFGTRVMAVSVGSAPVSAEVFAFMKRCFADLWVSEGYGSTEVGSIAYDGKPADNVAIELRPGPDRGEIFVKSPHSITGYLGDEGYVSPLGEDGFYATGDLGERDGEGRVRVIGRVRNTVKLAQGEFVSAERIESALASDPMVDRIYVHVENGAPGVAALVVPHAEELARALGVAAGPLDELVASPDAALRVMAALRARGRGGGLAAYEIPRAVRLESSVAITTSNKLARAELATRYGAELAALARGTAEVAADDEIADGDLLARVLRAARTVTGTDVDPREPLGSGVGVDSLAAAEILSVLADDLGRDVPLAWWFEARTLEDLANRLGRFAGGEAGAQTELARADRELDLGFATVAPARARPPRRVLLTGATGFLGAHLVEAFIARGIGVTCLVRGDDPRARLAAALAKYRVPTMDVEVVAGDLGKPLPEVGDVDAIVHAGATVSWLASYHALRAPNVLGTRALLELAAARGLAMHHVSTISVAQLGGDETTSLSFEAALAGTPYGLSKWLAERVVLRARAAGLPVAIYRPAMIANHSTRGAGNADDLVNRYFAGCIELGRYLDRPEILDLTPVDFVASAIAALVVARPDPDATYHLANVDQSPSFAAIGRAFVAAGHRMTASPYAEFRAALLASKSRLVALAAFFPERFSLGMGPIPCERTLAALAPLGVVRPAIDDAILRVYAASRQ